MRLEPRKPFQKATAEFRLSRDDERTRSNWRPLGDIKKYHQEGEGRTMDSHSFMLIRVPVRWIPCSKGQVSSEVQNNTVRSIRTQQWFCFDSLSQDSPLLQSSVLPGGHMHAIPSTFSKKSLASYSERNNGLQIEETGLELATVV